MIFDFEYMPRNFVRARRFWWFDLYRGDFEWRSLTICGLTLWWRRG